jgi:hypothetical protein
MAAEHHELLTRRFVHLARFWNRRDQSPNFFRSLIGTHIGKQPTTSSVYSLMGIHILLPIYAPDRQLFIGLIHGSFGRNEAHTILGNEASGAIGSSPGYSIFFR